jgi:hypothetical protein
VNLERELQDALDVAAATGECVCLRPRTAAAILAVLRSASTPGGTFVGDSTVKRRGPDLDKELKAVLSDHARPEKYLIAYPNSGGGWTVQFEDGAETVVVQATGGALPAALQQLLECEAKVHASRLRAGEHERKFPVK